MFIPIGTDRRTHRPTLMTYWIIGVTVTIFVVTWLMQSRWPEAYKEYILPLYAFSNHNWSNWWGLLTYQFLHAGWMHLLGNMLFLWVFGPAVEDRFRRIGFLGFYLVGGIVAACAHGLFERTPAGSALIGGVVVEYGSVIPPVIGASGAVAAVTGAFLVLFPLTQIRILLFFILIGVISIPSWWFIAFAIARDLVFTGFFYGADNVARIAHLGGYVYGAGIALTLLLTGVIPREMYDLLAIGKRAKRRRQFKAVTSKGASPWSADASKVRAGTAGRRGKAAAEDDRLAERRREIASLLAGGDPAAAARAYATLLDEAPEAVLGRASQLEVANQSFIAGNHAAAAAAYERFLDKYAADREAPRVRLMLALLDARYLNDPVAAKRLLAEVTPDELDDEHRGLRAALLEELG